MNYLLKDDGVIVSDSIKGILDDIGFKFRSKYHELITITSGRRTAKSQASAMYSNFVKEKGTATQRKKYINKKLFDEIASAFEKYQTKSKTLCVGEMEKVIKRQVQKKQYISKHLIDSAVDIRTKDLEEEEIDYIIELIQPYTVIVSYQDKRNNKNPHIHLQLKSGIKFI